MSIGKIVTVSCDARFEVGLDDLRAKDCEKDWGDVFETLGQATTAIRAAGWTIGKDPENGKPGYVRCPACAEAARHRPRTPAESRAARFAIA